MSFYHQDDCENWQWSKISKFEPGKPCRETDILGGVWTYKPDEGVNRMNNDLISREALKKHKFPINIADGVEIKEIEVVPVASIDNAPEVELTNHLRDRIKVIDHEITIPQSYEAKCFLDGKRKAFQYVLDLLEIKRGEEE